MVTQQSWMFLHSFVELRAISEEKLLEAQKRGLFTGLLREASIETLAHLGEFAFEEAAAAGAFAAMFVLANRKPSSEHTIVALRIVGVRSALGKSVTLLQAALGKPVVDINLTKQLQFLKLSEKPIVYWIGNNFFRLLTSESTLGKLVDIKQGLATTNDARYTRYIWE